MALNWRNFVYLKVSLSACHHFQPNSSQKGEIFQSGRSVPLSVDPEISGIKTLTLSSAAHSGV